MIIYNRNGDELIDVPITSSAVRKRVLMGDNYVSLPFSHDTYIDFAPGSYIIYNGLKFEIIDADKNRPTRNATTGGWDYTLQFDDQERHMTRAIVFWLSQKPREAVFHDTTDLQSFGNLIVENMNAFVPAKNWRMRDLSDELKEGTKLVSFNGDTCWNAVNTIAETFGVEWWTEQSEGYIYLCFGKLEIGTEEDFVEGDVITSIPSRRGDDSNYGTRFYVFGSTRNLTEDYGQADQGGTTNHVSEIRLRLPGGQEYIDARPDMVWNDVIEKFVVFEDIYPKNTDTVTSVEKVKRQTDSGTEYEARVIYAKDTPFLPTDLIPGETLQAVITSGALSGRTFDIQLGAAFDDPDAWNPETNPFDRKFEIVADVETTGEQEIIIPNDNLDIEPGDTFVLTGIKLPGARIGEAEQELLEAGTTWAQKNSKDTSVYDCPTNPVYCQLNDKSYELGQKVRLVNEAQFGSSGRSSRIQGYEKSLDNEYQATYTVGDNTAYSRLGEIEKDIQEAAYAERIGVTNGVGIYLIRAKYDQTQPTDYNAYSAAAADEKFLSRKKNDTAEGIITFAKGILANTLSSEKFVSGNEGKGHSTWIDDDGVSHTEVDQVKARKTVVAKQIAAEEGNVTELTSTNIEATVLTVLDKIIAKDQTLSGKISSAKFLSGLLGYGWMIDAKGNGELHSLSIRSFLEVPELRYNQVQVVGDELWVTAGGVISDVQAADSGRYTITLKLEEGQINPFAADDILRGIYHVSTGFSTIQMRVDSVAEDGTMTVTPRTPDLVPQKFMNIAKTGNFTNTARQRSILISSKQGRIQFMADVNDWEIAPSMVRMILGDTSGFVHPSFGDTSGYNAFLENILMTGRIFQKSADGTTTKPVAVNKGEWEAGTYYYYDEVTHKGSLWLCTADSTSEEPSASSIDWVEEVASGAGSAGPAGPALRSRGVWSASETYINGGEFRDWVLYGEHNYRYVVKEGVAAVPAGTLPTDTAYWTPFNEMEPVATRVLLADDAWIDILSTNGIRIGDNGWELTDGEIRHKTSGLKLTKDGKLVAPNGLSLVVGEENIDDYTQQKIDSVEIGTVNLLDDTKNRVGTASIGLLDFWRCDVIPGRQYTARLLNTGNTPIRVFIGEKKSDGGRLGDYGGNIAAPGEVSVYTFTTKSEASSVWVGIMNKEQSASIPIGDYDISDIMLVEGNKAPATWSPSLNDQKAQTQEQIDSIQVGSDNLMDDTQRPNPSNTELWNKTVSASVWGEVGEFVAVKIRGQWGRLWQSIAEGFIGGQQYRFSCWVKRDASMETTETKAQFSVGRNAVTIISATLDGVKLGAGGSTGVFSGKSLAGIVISADTFQRLECIFEASETVPGDSFRLEFYTSNYQTNTPCGVVYGYYLVKGNKATDDWRPSLNDTKKAIAAAQAAADQAKEDAAASAQKLEDWSSDELISPPEKPGLVQQKADIESEYGEIGSQADRYGIKSSTYWTAYNSAYTLAIQALTKYTASTPESIPVESDYNYIAAYYPKRQVMLDQIAAAAQSYTDRTINDSIPATRNLALKTEGQLDFDASSWAGLYLDLAEQPVIGQQYVLSWDDIQFTETSHPSIRLWINSFTGAVYVKDVTQTGPGSVVVTIPDTLLTDQTYRILFGGHNGAMTGYVKNPMWSKGNKVMPWTPAIEDAPNEIREEAKATGIYLSEKKIDVVADRFRITSTAGREIMRADADGNRVSMENLDVQAGATIGPVEVTETGLAVKAEGEDLQTVISNQEFGSLSDALGTGKTSIVALTAPSVSQPGGQFDMGTFSAPDATVRILSVSGRVIMMNGLNSVRIYLTKQVGSQWTDLGIELFSMASNSHYDENFTKSVVISSIGNYKIACTAVCGGVITISNMSGTLQEQVKRMEVRPSTIFGMLNSTQYFLLGREKPSASGSEIFRAKIQNEDGGLEVTSTGVNVDGETYIDGQTTIKGNASVVGKFSAIGEINATGNIQSDTDIEAVRDILIGRYLKGLAIPSEKIPSSMTSGSNYQIADSATCIDAMNTNAISITLPKNPKTGQIILIRQYSAGYTLKGGGKQIHRAGSTVSEFWNDAYGSLMWMRFDGSYWALNYMPSL
jgi:hypothetical protein